MASDPIEFAADVGALFERLAIPYCVVGSVASTTWGEPRMTNDVDFVVQMSRVQYGLFVASVPAPWVVFPREFDFSGAAFEGGQIMDSETAFRCDLFLVGDGEFERSAFAMARMVELLPGRFLSVASPEHVVLAKLMWFEIGNRISDRQWNDVVQVLEVQAGLLDEDFLNRWADHFGVRKLMDEARKQTR